MGNKNIRTSVPPAASAMPPRGLRLPWVVIATLGWSLLLPGCVSGPRIPDTGPMVQAPQGKDALQARQGLQRVAGGGPRLVLKDSDGDGTPDEEDPCPFDPGPDAERPCPSDWGYFFIRVLDHAQRTPVEASVALQPSVYRIIMSEDGYAGILRPGTYALRVEARGYAPVIMTLEIGSAEKALVEVTMMAMDVADPAGADFEGKQ